MALVNLLFANQTLRGVDTWKVYFYVAFGMYANEKDMALNLKIK